MRRTVRDHPPIAPRFIATTTGFAHLIHMTARASLLIVALSTALSAAFAQAKQVPSAPPSTKPTTGLSSTQTSVEGAKTLFPDATPEVVTAVTQKIFPAVVRLDVAQEIYSEGKRNLRRG